MDEVAQQFADRISADLENENSGLLLDDQDVINELFGDPEPEGEEAEEAPVRQIKILNPGGGDDVIKVQKPKRVMLKLDLDKLFSERGLSAIPNHIKPLKLRGKGHELEDITNICKAYEHWAHRLYPKMTFSDVLEKVEHLGLKNRKKCFNKRMEIYDEARRMALVTGKDNRDSDEEPDFMETEVAEKHPDNEVFGEPRSPSPAQPNPIQTTTTPVQSSPVSLTAEQIERMRINRIKALERKKQRKVELELTTAL